MKGYCSREEPRYSANASVTNSSSGLQPRVDLEIRGIAVVVLAPVRARIIPIAPRQVNRPLALKELHTKPLTDVPRDVAVHEPSAWVVGREREHDPALAGQEGDVATRWVGEVEVAHVGGLVEDAGASAEDVEVVAVEVDRVRDGDFGAVGLLDDPVGPLRWGVSLMLLAANGATEGLR